MAVVFINPGISILSGDIVLMFCIQKCFRYFFRFVWFWCGKKKSCDFLIAGIMMFRVVFQKMFVHGFAEIE